MKTKKSDDNESLNEFLDKVYDEGELIIPVDLLKNAIVNASFVGTDSKSLSGEEKIAYHAGVTNLVSELLRLMVNHHSTTMDSSYFLRTVFSNLYQHIISNKINNNEKYSDHD